MNQKKIDKSFTDHTLPKDPNKPFMINGIQFANRKEYDERVQQDAEAMASFLYDMYQEKKRKERDAT
jgi:hypothetical protein